MCVNTTVTAGALQHLMWFDDSLHCINTLWADFICKVNVQCLLNFQEAAILYILNLPLKIALVLETYGINLMNCKEVEGHLNW